MILRKRSEVLFLEKCIIDFELFRIVLRVVVLYIDE